MGDDPRRDRIPSSNNSPVPAISRRAYREGRISSRHSRVADSAAMSIPADMDKKPSSGFAMSVCSRAVGIKTGTSLARGQSVSS